MVAIISSAVAASVAITLHTTPEILAKPAACRVAERTPDEEQREAQTDDRLRSAAGVQEKRQEQQITHPRRRIERADDEE